jgi:CheY-like chemotaxis protein
MIVRCPQCKEENRLRDYSPGERVTSYLCPSCNSIVRLDLAQDEVHSSSAATSFERTERKRKILVADDTEVILSLVAELLNEAGFEVIIAREGMETMRQIRDQHPDLVVLDLLMPKMTGFDVLREMEKDERIRAIPVLVMSGVYKEDIVTFLQHLGARGFIDKDTLQDNLVFRVNSLLPGSQTAS